MRVISEFFDDGIISKGKWSARSPDLSPPDFSLWGLLKDILYRNKALRQSKKGNWKPSTRN